MAARKDSQAPSNVIFISRKKELLNSGETQEQASVKARKITGGKRGVLFKLTFLAIS